MSGIEESVATITTAVGWLERSVADLTRRQSLQLKRTRRLAIVALVGLFINVVLIIAGGFLTNKVITESAANIRAAADASGVHLRFTLEGTCPIYEIILSGYNPKSPDALASPAAYEEQFRQFRQAARDLGCRLD